MDTLEAELAELRQRGARADAQNDMVLCDLESMALARAATIKA